MKTIYFSLTGNCRRFAEKLCKYPVALSDIDTINEPCILVFPTIGFGKVPTKVIRFLKKYKEHVKFVVSSGNRNWGPNFAVGADTVTEKLGIPSYKIELAGTNEDVQNVLAQIDD